MTQKAWAFSSHGDNAIEPLMPLSRVFPRSEGEGPSPYPRCTTEAAVQLEPRETARFAVHATS